MTGQVPFDANSDWTNPYCGNTSNDPLVDKLIGNAYHVVRTVYCNLGNLKLIYDFLSQYGMVLGVQSETELKAMTTSASYVRLYGFDNTNKRVVTDYLYVDGDRTGILPDDPAATGSWILVATSGSEGGDYDGKASPPYIPYIYNNGSAIGGETTIAVPVGTVGVPFIIIEGHTKTVTLGYTYDPSTLTVTLAQPLEIGDEVVLLLTGTPAVPDNPNVTDWVQINWLYNGGYASGGEQVIAIPYTFESVPVIYKNGDRYYAGLANKSYTVDAANQRILLTEPLVTNDRLIVTIGGESTTLIMSDRTVQEVARSANVHENEVILSTNTTQYLNGMKVIYDVVEQKIYGLPVLPTNVYIISVSNGQLTYAPGNITVDLTAIPDSAVSLKEELAKVDGESLIGVCPTIAVLRTIEPKSSKQLITVREYATNTGKGGGRFRAVQDGSAYTDNGGTIIKTTGGAAWLRVNSNVLNFFMFGAIGDGVTDDTVAMDNTFLYATTKGEHYFAQHPVGESILNYASLNGPKIQVPPGRFRYLGNGFNLNDTTNQLPIFNIEGDSKGASEIMLDADNYLINTTVNPYQFAIRKLKVYGGLGMAKFDSNAQNQVQLSTIEDCFITAFRECAIGLTSQDWPNVKIRNCQFIPRAGFQTICIMLSGWCANSEITGCEFALAEGTGIHSYGIKLNIALADSGSYRGPTTPLLIADNGTYRRNSVDGSTSLWIVPNPSTNVNAGRAIVCRGNKWGAENVNSNVYHILVADESPTGSWAGAKRHLTSISSGYLRGLVLDKNNIRFETNQTQPYIASFTPHIQGLVCEDIIDNAIPGNILEFRGGMTYANFTPQDSDNLVSTRYWLAATDVNYSGKPVSTVSNFPSTVRIIDERGYLNTPTSTTYPGESSVAYTNLMSLANSASGTANGMTKTVIANSIGIPSEAVSLVASTDQSRISYPLTGWTANRIIWVEMELARGSSNSLDSITIEIVESDTVKYHRRYWNLTSEWKLCRIPLVLPSGATKATLRIVSNSYTAANTTFKIGRVAMYHASEPINTGHVRSIGSAWNSVHLVMEPWHFWVDATGALRKKNGAPTSDLDGALV